eukprot:9796544-Alexandrium_andersonii.AAC.1
MAARNSNVCREFRHLLNLPSKPSTSASMNTAHILSTCARGLGLSRCARERAPINGPSSVLRL